MTMKQRITALLLAGLLAAALVACERQQQRPDNPPADSTTTATPTPDTPPTPEVVWTDVDEVVYVTAPMTLTGVENASDTSAAKAMDSLKRIKIGSNNQSIVVKNDKQYYAASKNLTTNDLEGNGFATDEAGKTLYADGSVNVRAYASSDSSFSTVKITLKLNDTVKLIADGGDWYKIEYTTASGKTEVGFVFAKYMAEAPVKDYNDLSGYEIAPIDPPVVQYVIVEKVNLRKAPSSHKNVEILEVLSKETEVKVVGSTTVEGRLWYNVWVDVTPGEGQSPVPLDGFISADCLSVNKDATSTRTLEDMLAEYTSFSKVDPALTLYATGKLNVRSTPAVTGESEKSNLIDTLTKATSVKVVAIGQADEDTVWAMIEYKAGEYYFVSYKYLTNDPEGGEMIPSLEQLIATYPAFSACTEKTVYAKGVVNCNSFPGNDKEVTRKLSAGDAAVVVATGTNYGAEWYIFKTTDGKLFFAAASMFTDTAPAA